MLDPKRIRNDAEAVKAGLAAKNHDPASVDRWLERDAERRDLLTRVEALKSERNTASKAIGKVKQGGGDASSEQERLRTLGEEIKSIDERVREVDAELHELAQWFPNPPHASVPVGGEEANRVLRTWGEPVRHDFDAKQHDELGAALGLSEFERAARMSGTGFIVLRGNGARLSRALVNFMLDLHTREHGFEEIAVPYLVKPETLFATGQLPKLAEDMYRTDEDGLYLIPTAEVSITNLYREETLAEEDLPRCFVGHSACFRREAGSHGKETRGLTRVHQFDKVEMVKFVHPDAAYDELESLLAAAEAVLQSLGLAYRVVLLASGDLSFAAAKCYDLEVWAPGAERWLEVSSCSVFEDFQARRAGIRFKPAGGGKPEFVHTLNASGLALPRTLIAVLETYQTADGAVTLPEVLHPYLGGLTELR
jgi:seryl-tRNA synthetase